MNYQQKAWAILLREHFKDERPEFSCEEMDKLHLVIFGKQDPRAPKEVHGKRHAFVDHGTEGTYEN